MPSRSESGHARVPHQIVGIDRSALEELSQAEGPCLTLYLAGHRAGSGSRPRSVRLRRMLAEAASLLEGRGVAPTDREKLLEPLEAILRANAAEIDSGDAGTLAVFRSPRLLRLFHLPWAAEDHVVVAGQFHIAPVATGLAAARRFYLLALSRNHTRLLECSPGHARHIPLPGGLPASVRAFEGFDVPDHTERNRSSAGVGLGAMKAVQFGTGSEEQKRDRYLHDYCRALARGLEPVLAAQRVPLVLMAAAGELPAFDPPPDAIVEASPDGGWTDFEMAEKGRVALAGWTHPDALAAGQAYLNAAPAKKSTELEQIVRTAAAGRVHDLFVAESAAPIRGDVGRLTGRALLAGQMPANDDDLVNAAIVETIRHGGHVWTALPEGCPSVAALFRY